MAIQSIYKTLKETKKDKVPMGYAVDYTSVLSYLYDPTVKVEVQASNIGDNALHTNANNFSGYYATLLGDGGSLSGLASFGFIEDKTLQQAVCVLKSYLAFPVKTKSGDNEADFNVISNLPTSQKSIHDGNTICGIKTTVADNITSGFVRGGEFRGENGDFLIGVGLDLKNFVPNYFRHFYGSLTRKKTETVDGKVIETPEDENVWDEKNFNTFIKNIPVLAEKKLLFAEITLDINGRGKILNAPVVVEIEDPPSGAADQSKVVNHLWLPHPLLLLNDYKTLCSLTIEGPEGKSLTTGKDDIKFPFESSGYEHKKGVIRNFKVSHYEGLVSKSESLKHLNLISTNWNVRGSEPDKKVRVRLYLDGDRKDEIEKIIGPIPQECEQILKPLNKIETRQIYDTTSVKIYDGIGEVYFEEGVLGDVTKDSYYKAIRIIWDFETGKSTGDASKASYVKGEHWVSYGVFQAIEEYGQVTHILKIYKELCESAGKSYDERLYGAALGMDLSALRALGKDPLMFTAQTKHFWKTKLKRALDIYKLLYFNCAAGVLFSLDASNHGVVMSTIRNMSSRFANLDEETKVQEYIKYRENYLRRISGGAKWRAYGGWRNKIKRFKENIPGNLDLAKPGKWNNCII